MQFSMFEYKIYDQCDNCLMQTFLGEEKSLHFSKIKRNINKPLFTFSTRELTDFILVHSIIYENFCRDIMLHL